MDDEPYYICEICRERIDPAEENVVFAVEVQRIDAMGPTTEYVEGLGSYFHEEHYPGGVRWRLKDKPQS